MIKFLPPKFWYHRGPVSYLLLPFSWVYRFVISLRRLYYNLFSQHFSVPVIVVGNITVGGTGKTPLVIYLVELLRKHGYEPGVISRGYGGKKNGSIIVTPASEVEEVGDEALLIVRRTKCPVVVAVDRVTAAKKLLTTYKNCNVIISDDGLQHYALPRDIEIAVIDASQEFGNGFCLPAGPLRESPSRLNQVDFIVNNFNTKSTFDVVSNVGSIFFGMFLIPTLFHNLKDPALTKTADHFKNQVVHAVAAIGNPLRFFQTLHQLGLNIIEHPFPDHYKFRSNDLLFGNETVIMTEKDAVKCDPGVYENFWYLEVTAKLSTEFVAKLLAKLSGFSLQR